MLNIFQTPVFKIQATNSKHFNALCICGHHAYFLFLLIRCYFLLNVWKKKFPLKSSFPFIIYYLHFKGSDSLFHSHYGAICCNGCRLFFHRTQQQKGKGPELKCKSRKSQSQSLTKLQSRLLSIFFVACLRLLNNSINCILHSFFAICL